jgi:23S rRNA (guanosine2251-2'-O)-methyltransferase
MAQLIGGRRAVREALLSGVGVVELHILSGRSEGELTELAGIASQQGIEATSVSKSELERLLPGVNHQGVVALIEPLRLLDLDELIELAGQDRPKPLVMLDGVQDPHNLGAVIRSAEALGAGGVIWRDRRAVQLTPAAIKASAGGAFRLPLCVVTNLDQTIRTLKKEGWWIYGLDAFGDQTIWELKLEGKLVLVLGSEGRGVSQLVRDRCDSLIRIPLLGSIASLNVSVSAGIVLAEWARQNTP